MQIHKIKFQKEAWSHDFALIEDGIERSKYRVAQTLWFLLCCVVVSLFTEAKLNDCSLEEAVSCENENEYDKFYVH